MRKISLGLAVLFSGLTALTLTAQAKDHFFDTDGDVLMQSPNHKAKAYQLWNTGSKPVTVTAVNNGEGAKAGYTTQLDAKKAALFVYGGGQQPPLKWTCQIPASEPSQLQKVACRTVLRVKLYPTKSLRLKADSGSYWLLENTSARDFKKNLKTAVNHST
jgi:hypothetical protein